MLRCLNDLQLPNFTPMKLTCMARKFVYMHLHVQCSGYSTSSDHQLYNVTPLKMPVRLLIDLLQSQSHVTITHNYSLRCVTFTQLTIIHIRNYNHLLHSYTGWLLSYQLLSQIITDFTSSHFETLAEILLFLLLLLFVGWDWVPRYLLKSLGI
jgi:hypothetical protein